MTTEYISQDLCFTKPIDEFPGYLICRDGKVISIERKILKKNGVFYKVRGRILRQSFDQRGYKLISLHKEGEIFTKRVHRLVAEAFIPNPLNFPEVNHLFGDKADNNYTSLEWSSSESNMHHRREVLGILPKHKKYKFVKTK
jgi:hypothetical protein